MRGLNIQSWPKVVAPLYANAFYVFSIEFPNKDYVKFKYKCHHIPSSLYSKFQLPAITFIF